MVPIDSLWVISCSTSIDLIIVSVAIFRPPDIVVGGLKFYRDSSIFIFIRQLPAEFAERNLTKTGHMLGSENACPKSGVSPPPKNRGAQKHLFGRFRKLTANLSAYIFGTNTRYT